MEKGHQLVTAPTEVSKAMPPRRSRRRGRRHRSSVTGLGFHPEKTMVRVPVTRRVVLLEQADIQPAGQNTATASASGPSQDHQGRPQNGPGNAGSGPAGAGSARDPPGDDGRHRSRKKKGEELRPWSRRGGGAARVALGRRGVRASGVRSGR